MAEEHRPSRWRRDVSFETTARLPWTSLGGRSCRSPKTRTCWPLQINEGQVVAVGPGRRTNAGEVIPVDVKEGDTVMLPEYGGQPLELGGEK